MALSIPQSNSSVGNTSPRRTRIVLTVYLILLWFGLTLLGSLLGVFVPAQGNFPLMLVLAVGGPILLFGIGYLSSSAFRALVYSLIGDPWGITAFQAYRVLGVVFLIQVGRQALPAAFGLPAGLGDLFVGITAPLAALAWSSGSNGGRRALILWNILGMLDLVAALSLGFLSATLPPTTASLRIFPLSLIPTFAVPLSFILHLVGLARIRHLRTNSQQRD